MHLTVAGSYGKVYRADWQGSVSVRVHYCPSLRILSYNFFSVIFLGSVSMPVELMNLR